MVFERFHIFNTPILLNQNNQMMLFKQKAMIHTHTENLE